MSNYTLLDLEGEMGSWSRTTFAGTAMALFFYNMNRHKFMNPRITSMLVILILMTTMIYMSYALYNFYSRTNILLNDNNNNRENIYNSRAVYTLTSSIINLTLISICIQILFNT
jgi:hypothetical protein|tara:strand:+ start:756 stop:1097 length:342 start_codon:yes stop_codon:yes gene_type:complete